MSLLDDKALLKVRYFLLESEKIVSKFKLFSRKDLVFKTGVSAHESTDVIARILGKEGIQSFTLKACTLLYAEGLRGVNQEPLYFFLR